MAGVQLNVKCLLNTTYPLCFMILTIKCTTPQTLPRAEKPQINSEDRR